MNKKMSKIEIKKIATQLAVNCGNPLDDDIDLAIIVNPTHQEIYQKRWERIVRILETHRYHVHVY